MSQREAVQLESGYVLHHRAYQNTSRIIDFLTESHGLVSLVAQGVRRPKAAHRAVLQPFVPLALSWVRRGELGKLTHLESQAQAFDFAGKQLMAGFYLNELLLRLLARGDPNPEAFSCYSRCLTELAVGHDVERPLRLFEFQLLKALGYELNLDHEVDNGLSIQPETYYFFELERGPVVCQERTEGADVFFGRDLIALREKVLDDKKSLKAAKRLLQRVLRLYLGERPLRTRMVLSELFGKGLEL